MAKLVKGLSFYNEIKIIKSNKIIFFSKIITLEYSIDKYVAMTDDIENS